MWKIKLANFFTIYILKNQRRSKISVISSKKFIWTVQICEICEICDQYIILKIKLANFLMIYILKNQRRSKISAISSKSSFEQLTFTPLLIQLTTWPDSRGRNDWGGNYRSAVGNGLDWLDWLCNIGFIEFLTAYWTPQFKLC